ncbi:MAG: AMP-binding protein, partial [Myxococcota bacterium]
MTPSTLKTIEAQLMAPGTPFALTREEVLGETMEVFAQRARSLRELLVASSQFGDVEYLVFSERRLTFAQHARAAASVAQALHERYGVGPGDRVAILAANCPEWIIAFWATVSLGAIAVGFNGWWVGDEIRYALQDCTPKLLIADPKRLARLPSSPTLPIITIPSQFQELIDYAPEAPWSTVPIAEDDPAALLYTSGTTGRPKGALSSHRNII